MEIDRPVYQHLLFSLSVYLRGQALNVNRRQGRLFKYVFSATHIAKVQWSGNRSILKTSYLVNSIWNIFTLKIVQFLKPNYYLRLLWKHLEFNLLLNPSKERNLFNQINLIK